MDIRDVKASSVSQKAQTAATSAARADASSSKREAGGPEVFFENSGRIGEVRALIDQLVQAPQVDVERIQRARELIASRAIDSREAASRAAGAMLEERSAQQV
jgi:hypothetical protein